MADSPAYHYCHGIPPGEASSSLQRSASDAFESSSELDTDTSGRGSWAVSRFGS
ncbi:hypothetical protein FRC04_011555 [Tulasnella sp. 424]|nr:hypothetical protein FRC04_011555 [Tulasnella sp. 424]